jgi:hypothetical protein
MKSTLPICIPAIPSPDASPEIWRQVAPILSAIAEREKRNEDLYPSERTAYNALSFAQYQATKKQWLNLWQYLLDRQVVQIGDIATPPPKPKSDRPTKPPKNKIKPETNKVQKTLKPSTSKALKPETKRRRVRNRERLSDRKSPTYLYEFVSLAPCLSGLLSVS